MRLNIPEADAVLNKYVPVLDHGHVALVDYMGGDLAVERFARGSYEINPKARSLDKTTSLLRYLVRKRHTSPLESTVLSFHLATPIFVARQWIRHRMSSTNELSGRYVEMPNLNYRPSPDEVRVQSIDNKQGSGGLVDAQTLADCLDGLDMSTRIARESYEAALEDGVARETARIQLPLSTYTFFNWKIDLHNLFHFLNLRCKPDAQAQTRAFADVVAGLTRTVAPICFDAFLDYQFNAVTFTRAEMVVLQDLLEEDGMCWDEIEANENHIRYTLAIEGVSNKREQGEFIEKLRRKPIRSFELDMTSARDASYFTEKAHAATA